MLDEQPETRFSIYSGVERRNKGLFQLAVMSSTAAPANLALLSRVHRCSLARNTNGQNGPPHHMTWRRLSSNERHF